MTRGCGGMGRIGSDALEIHRLERFHDPLPPVGERFEDGGLDLAVEGDGLDAVAGTSRAMTSTGRCVRAKSQPKGTASTSDHGIQ